MKKWGLFLFAILAVNFASAQEFVYDNLPAGQISNEISFVGKWCSVNSSPFFGTKSLQNCGKPAPSEYNYSPLLPNGIYNIYVRWVANKRYSNTVPVAVTYSDYFVDPFTGAISTISLTNEVTVDQTISSNGWFFVGTYSSIGGTGALGIRLTNANGDVNTDGVRLVRVSEYPPPF